MQQLLAIAHAAYKNVLLPARIWRLLVVSPCFHEERQAHVMANNGAL